MTKRRQSARRAFVSLLIAIIGTGAAVAMLVHELHGEIRLDLRRLEDRLHELEVAPQAPSITGGAGGLNM